VVFHLSTGADPLPGYRLEHLLGQGGCGQVWKAARPGGGHVALKFVPLPSAAAVVERRALQSITGIHHPNLIVLFGAWEIDGYLLIGMELADRTLLDRFQEARAGGLPGIPFEELVEYFDQAARGLDHLNAYHHLHPHGGGRPVAFQHRDVKPQNLFLVGGGVKVGDWGLVRILEETAAGHTGHLTPAYAAPEFFSFKTTSTSDQYSLAVSYAYLRTGRLPFPVNPREGHLHHAPDLGRIDDRQERHALERALAKNPLDRWPSCREFIAALRPAVSPSPGPPPGVVPTVDFGSAALGRPVFYYGSVVPPQHFIDRERELAEAEQIIDACQSFLIVGKHRVGKTSFCKKLIHHLMGRPNNQVLATYINLQAYKDLTHETFLEHTLLSVLGEIARQVFRCKWSDATQGESAAGNPLLAGDRVFASFVRICRAINERTQARQGVVPAPLRFQEFEQFTRDLLELVRLRGYGNFVLVYDEANRLPRDLSVNLLVSNEEALNSAGVISVYVASPEMAEAFRPLYESFGRELPLGPFPSIADLRRLLACSYFNDPSRAEDIPVSAEALEMLWNVSRGQPYLIQLLAGRSSVLAYREEAGAVQARHVTEAHEALKAERRLAFADDTGPG
jgi:serine/threonine protein kinase